MAKKTKKVHKVICKAKENGRTLQSASLDSDLPTHVPANEDTAMEATASPTTDKQAELMDLSQALCKHLNKGVNNKKLLHQIGNSPLLQCKACTNLDETDSRRKKVKKAKGNNSTKKGSARSKTLLQSEDDWPTNTWVCLTCGYIGCGSIPDSFLEGGKKKIGVIVASEETIERGHIWQHCLGVNHPCALQCGNSLLWMCFICRSSLQYNFSNGTNEENWADDWAGNLGLSVLQVWKVIKEKLFKISNTINGIRNSTSDDLLNEKGGTLLEVDEADALVLGGHIVKGLINLGNTCFFNSVMQNLLALDVLRDHFTQPNAEFQGSVTCSLRKLYMETSLKKQDKVGELDTSVSSSGIRKGRKGRMSVSSGHASISPGSLFGAISAKAPRFKGFQQQDSHELLKYLLDSLKTEELKTRKLRSKNLSKSPGECETDKLMDGQEQTFVDNIFGGQLSSTVCCCECGYSSVTYEPFLDLSLHIPTNESFKKSSLTQGQNKHAPLSAVENSSEKKKMRKDDRKGKKNHGKKNQGLYKNETAAEEEMVVHSQKFLSSASENITSSTAHEPTTEGDSEQIKSLLQDKQSTEGPCQSVLGQSEHMEQTEETDIQNIVHRCNGIMLNGAETMSLKQTYHPKAIFQNGDNPHKNAACSETLENSISKGAHFDCQDRSAIHSNEMNCEIEQDVDNGLNAEDGIGVEPINNCETFVHLGTKVDQAKHLVESQLATDCEHVDMDCNGVAQLLTSEISSIEKQEEKHEAKKKKLCQEKERHVLNEAKKDAATEISNRASRQVTTNTIVPKSVEGCLTSFTNPELLSGENAWECRRCSISFAKDSTNNRIIGNKNHEVCINKNIEQLSTMQGHQMQIREFSCDSMMEEADAENKSIDRANRPITRSCMRLRERNWKECGAHDEKVDFEKVDVNERRSLRSQGRKQRLEKVEPMETDTEPKKVMRDATKQYRISKAPHVLTIHLKRFTQDLRGRLSKLSGHVTFQEKLDLTPFLDPKCIGKESSTYRLIGVVEHSGSMRGGHYVAYVRGPQNENDEDSMNKNFSGQNTWYYISDAHVSKTSLSDVLTSEAYLLFYQRW